MNNKEELFQLINSRMLVRLSRNEIIFVTTDLRVLYLNDRARTTRGIEQADNYYHINFADLYEASLEESLEKGIEQLKTQSVVFLDLRTFNPKTEEFHYINCRITAFYTKEKRLVGYAFVGYDVTTEVKAREELVYSRNLFSTVIQTSAGGIIIVDNDGFITDTNPAMAKMFGYKREELIGIDVDCLLPKGTDIQFYRVDEHATSVGVVNEYSGVRKDGSLFPVLLGVGRVVVGEDIYFTGYVHDLSKTKRQEEQLRSLNKELEERVTSRTEELAETVNRLLQEINERKAAERALRKSQKDIKNALEKERELGYLKTQFISTASHEFRTPLSAVRTSAELLLRLNEMPDAGDKRQRHIKRVIANVDNLVTILEEFLSVTRLEEGRGVDVKKEKILVPHFIKKAIDNISGFRKKKQNIIYKHLSEEEKEIVSDENLLKNIVVNLLSNAVKYSTDNSAIHITTNIVDNEFELIVKDQGIGIPEEEQKHLFERFFRAKNTTAIQGTGLGLNIVKQYIELLGGSISFESRLNQGTTFFVRLSVS